MSKTRIIVSLGLATFVGALLLFSFRQSSISLTPRHSDTLTLSPLSLRIDFGDGQAKDFSSIPYVTGATAFSILKDAMVPIVYDPSMGAGVFVRQIGDKKNGDGGKYWQYWVNADFAMVAADKYLLKPGDRVEWKFVTAQKM